jgi:hypothetical protein
MVQFSEEGAMSTDMTIYLDDRPGQVASVGRALGVAGINIDGGFGLVVGGQGIMHILVRDEDAEGAGHALMDAGFEVRNEQPVMVVELDDRPGALGEIAQRAADAGVNLTVFYLATTTRGVLGADDFDALQNAIGTA